jgi:hypothetical protein
MAAIKQIKLTFLVIQQLITHLSKATRHRATGFGPDFAVPNLLISRKPARGKMGTPTYRNLLYNKDFYTTNNFLKKSYPDARSKPKKILSPFISPGY